MPDVVETLAAWVRDFIFFHSLRHPETLGEKEIGSYLTHLALVRNETLPRQVQTREVLRLLYREFSHRDPRTMDAISGES